MEQFDVVVVGAGLVGAGVAHELANAGASILVVEKGPEIAAASSRSNSGLLCTGFDTEPGSLEARMIADQSWSWRAVFDSLKIPYRVPGALVLARDEDEAASLSALAENADRNGVVTELLATQRLRRLEPGASAVAALLVPGEAITDPYEVVRRLLASGPEVRTDWQVTRVEQRDGLTEVSGPAGKVRADLVVNCAGLYADEVAADDAFRISPRRGEFIVFERGTARLVNHILLPVPKERTKGVLVFPTVHGHLCAGPTAVDQMDKEDWRPRQEELERVREEASAVFPELAGLAPTGAWAGLRPVGHPHDYIVRWSERVPTLLNIAGIRSTGLSSCLGLARLALNYMKDRGFVPRGTGKALSRPWKTAAPVSDTPPAELKPWWERHNEIHPQP